jgi:Na+(H+)/acetate symporter ActP
MDLTTLTYIVVGLSFALYIGIAIWSRASTTGEFYVAGKGVNPVVNGMATAADWMSAASFISMAGLIAFLGYGGSVYLMGWTGGYCLLAMLLAPYLRKYGKFTVPEFIGDRYYSKTARIVAVICLIFISFTYVAGQMRGVGIVFSRFLERTPDRPDRRHGHRLRLCRSWWHEGDYLYSGCAILRADRCLYHSGNLHRLPADRQSAAAAGIRFDG